MKNRGAIVPLELMETKMACPENNPLNRFELATKIVSGWSREELEDYVMNQLESEYRASQEYFESTWADYKTSFEWSAELRDSMKKDCPNPGCYCMACEKKDDDIEQWQIEDATNGRR